MALKPLQYTIPESTRVPWTATQEKSISHEYPLNVRNESCEDFIARTYHISVPLAPRINNAARASCAVHVAHTRLLERLLLTTRPLTNKYHVELPSMGSYDLKSE
ncbi:hypothetical protein B0H13DRAFT_108613 [Mycena leptocephala]|nr:hypothetical protein B0H13DRAFT_108613 [Mycena leptocephala]